VKLAFVDKLTELAEADPNIMLLTGDLGFQIFDGFIEKHGPRYINVGVAEANMIDTAAGLAHVGRRPVAYSIASFATTRCFEQIKLSVAYAGLPVVIVGAGGGYGYCENGPTHHAGEDLALMCSLPGMTVVAPGDAGEVQQLLSQVMKLSGPAYFRIGRGREPVYHADAPVVLGKARLLQQGERIAVLSTGEIAGQLVEALKICRDQDMSPLAYQYHTVKPFDAETLAHIAERVDAIVTIEEHVPFGGFGAQVACHLSAQSHHPVLKRLSVADEFVLGGPHKDQMRRDYGLDAQGIAETLMALWAAPAAVNTAEGRQ